MADYTPTTDEMALIVNAASAAQRAQERLSALLGIICEAHGLTGQYRWDGSQFVAETVAPQPQ